MKTVCTANAFAGAYGDSPSIKQANDGSFRTIGCGYAGRVRYASSERAMRVVEADARFSGWKA